MTNDRFTNTTILQKSYEKNLKLLRERLNYLYMTVLSAPIHSYVLLSWPPTDILLVEKDFSFTLSQEHPPPVTHPKIH